MTVISAKMTSISTYEFPREEIVPELFKSQYSFAKCVEEYGIFSNWILSKSQPLFIAYKYFEKLVFKGKINKLTMDILTVEIFKFIKIEMNKIMLETLNHPRIRDFKRWDIIDPIQAYMYVCGDTDDPLREDNLHNLSVKSGVGVGLLNEKESRLERYNIFKEEFERVCDEKMRIVVIYQRYSWKDDGKEIYRIVKVCNKTLKVINLQTGALDQLNMATCDRNIFVIEDDNVSLDELRVRFSFYDTISFSTELKNEIRRFGAFFDRMTPIMEYENEEYIEKYGEFINHRNCMLNYKDILTDY